MKWVRDNTKWIGLGFLCFLTQCTLFNDPVNVPDEENDIFPINGDSNGVADTVPSVINKFEIQYHWDFSKAHGDTVYDLVNRQPAVLHGTIEHVTKSKRKGVQLDLYHDYIAFERPWPNTIQEGQIEISFELNKKGNAPISIFGDYTGRLHLLVYGDSIIFKKNLSGHQYYFSLIADYKVVANRIYQFKGTWGQNGMKIYINNILVAKNNNTTFYGSYYNTGDSSWTTQHHNGSPEPWHFYSGRHIGRKKCCLYDLEPDIQSERHYGFDGILYDIKLQGKSHRKPAVESKKPNKSSHIQYHWDFSSINNDTVYDLIQNHPAIMHGNIEAVPTPTGQGIQIDREIDWVEFGNFLPKIVHEGSIEVTFKLTKKHSEPISIFGNWGSRFLLYIWGDSILYNKGLSHEPKTLIANQTLYIGKFYTLRGSWGNQGMKLFLNNELIAHNNDTSFYGSHFNADDSAWVNRFHSGSPEPWEFFAGRKNGCCLENIGLPHLYNKYYGFDGVIDKIKVWAKP